jgi:hypothetical protein
MLRALPSEAESAAQAAIETTTDVATTNERRVGRRRMMIS